MKETAKQMKDMTAQDVDGILAQMENMSDAEREQLQESGMNMDVMKKRVTTVL